MIMAILTYKVLTDMRHRVELLFTDVTGELLLCVTVYNLIVFMQGPELLKCLPAC